MRPIHVGDTETLQSVARALRGIVLFRLNGNRIVADFRCSGGVPYRFRREGDLIHVERRVADLVAVPRPVDRAALLLKNTVEKP